MVSKTNLKIAFSHLSSRKKQAFVAILSVTFGVSMYIFMSGFMGGFNSSQTDASFTSKAHIRVYNDSEKESPKLLLDTESKLYHVRNAKSIQYTEGIKDADKILSQLANSPNYASLTSQVNFSSTFKNGLVHENGIVSGVNVENENKMFDLKDLVTEGNWDLLENNNNIVLGVGLAEKLSVELNDFISVNTSDNKSKNFRVVCLLKTGSPAVDDSKAFIKKAAALQLVSKNRSYATDIQINIPDYNQAEKIAETLKKTLPYQVESWQESSSEMVSANKLRGIISLAISLTIMLVAGFGIYNIMNMTVNEKIKDIAILKALGFSGNDVIQIFLTQAIIIGIFGGVSGVAMGFGLCSIIDRIPFEMASMDTLPMSFDLSNYITAFIFGILVTVLAGYLPAKGASKVDPVTIIRG